MARKINSDSVKPGCGIDRTLGESFTRQHKGDPWNPPKLTDEVSPAADRKAKHSSNDDAGLRRVGMDSGTASYAARDIFNDVEENLGPSGAIKRRGE